MKLSMVMIVRDEEENIVQTLDSFWADVDEVVLVDTGSKDHTVRRAREYANSLGQGPDTAPKSANKLVTGTFGWIDDFSAARTYADSLATGDWLSWCDADDTVKGLPYLRNLVETVDPQILGLYVSYNYAQDEQGECICELWRERLVRAGAGTWIDRVHESQFIKGPVLKVDSAEAQWVHRKPPFDPSDRNLKILEKWIEDEPQNPRVLLNLARDYLGTQKFDKAVPIFERFLSLPGQEADVRAQASRHLSQSLCAIGRFEWANQVSLKSFGEYPFWPDTHLTFSELAMARQDWRRSIYHAERAKELGKPETLLIVNPQDYDERPRSMIAISLAALGRLDEAIELGEGVLRDSPGYLQLPEQLAQWQGGRQREQTAKLWAEHAGLLCAYDEPLKAWELLETVPHYALDHPQIILAREQVSDVLAEPYEVAPLSESQAAFLLKGLTEQNDDLEKMQDSLEAEGEEITRRGMLVLDPAGNCRDLIEEHFPDATIDAMPEHPYYDAICFYGDLDNALDPEARLAALMDSIAPNGRVYAGIRQGRNAGGHTQGRKRAWRSVELADMLRHHSQIVDFGIDEQGYVSASMDPIARRGEVSIYTGRAIGPWHPMDIEEQGLGGSETAAWRLSEELNALGYIVTLYGDFAQQGAVKNVVLRHYTAFDRTRHQRAVIVFRDAEPFDKQVNADKKFLWLEDVAGAEGLTPERAANLDYVCTVSEWHTGNLKEVHPWLEDEKIVTSRNGLTLAFFEDRNGDGPPKREKRVLFTSSPDRGLDIVLECWPEIKKRVPEATFVHCYSRWWDLVANVNPVSAGHRARVEEMSRADGVEKIPSQGQRDLALLMRSSRVWVHPSYWTLGEQKFYETNCISVQEAQAAGCVTVSASWGAVGEMNKAGVKLDGEPMTEEFRSRFIKEIVDGLLDDRRLQKAEIDGPAAMKAHGWEPVAHQLEALIGG